MNPLNSLFEALLRASIEGTILIVGVLVLQWVLRRWLTPAWRFALWGLVMVRLVLPTLPASSLSWRNWISNSQPVAAAATRAPESDVPASWASSGVPIQLSDHHTQLNSAVSAQVPSMPAISWAAGSLLFLLGIAVRKRRFIGAIRRGKRIQDEKLTRLCYECAKELSIRRSVELVQTDCVSAPAILGFWRLRLLLPAGFTDEISDAELRLVFLHELMHVRRFDLLLNGLWIAVQVLHWFNPVAWYALRRLRADRELACDAAVLQMLSPDHRHAYGTLLVRLMEKSSVPDATPGLTPFLNQTTELKRRIIMISSFRTTSRFLTAVSSALFITLGFVTLTGAPDRPLVPSAVQVLESAAPQSSGTIASESSVKELERSVQAIEQELKHQKVKILDRQMVLDKIRKELGIPDGGDREGLESSDTNVRRRLEAARDELRSEFMRRNALYSSLSGLSKAELKSVSVTALSDPILNRLFQSQADYELKLVEASVEHGPAHPTVKAQLKVKETIDRQIEERLDGVLAGLKIQLENDQARINASEAALENHRAEERKRAEQRHPYDEVRKELRALELMREKLQERLIQKRVDLVSNPVTTPARVQISSAASSVVGLAVKKVHVNKEGKFFLGENEVSLDGLMRTLQEAQAISPVFVVHLSADEDAPSKAVFDFVNQCEANGILNLSLKSTSSR